MVNTKEQSNAIVYCVSYVVWFLKKSMGRNALEILMPSVNSVNIYSIWLKSLSLSFIKLILD